MRRRSAVLIGALLAAATLAGTRGDDSKAGASGHTGPAAAGASNHRSGAWHGRRVFNLLPGQMLWGVGAARGARLWTIACEPRCHRHGEASVVRIDSRTGTVQPIARIRDPAETLALGYGSLWTLDFDRGVVSRIDPRTGRLQATIHLRLPRPLVPGDRAFLPLEITLGHGAAWVSTDRGWVAEIDAASNRVVRMIRTPPDGTCCEIAYGRRHVWVAAQLAGVIRIDPTTGRRVDIPVCWGRCHATGRRLDLTNFAVGAGAVWATGGFHDPPNRTWRCIRRSPCPGLPRQRPGLHVVRPAPGRVPISGSHGAVFIGRPGQRRIQEFSPPPGCASTNIPLGRRGIPIAATRRALWVQLAHHRLERVPLTHRERGG